MGRSEQSLPAIGEEQRVEVEAELRRRDLAPRVRERLELAKAVALGQELASIACWSGRSPHTVRRWVGRFAAGGVPALADAAQSGHPAVADGRYRQAAEAALDAGPRALGLPFDVWTSGRLAAYLERETGGHLSPGWLRALLGRWDWTCGRPKHTLKHLQDAAAVAACEEELAAAARKMAAEPDRYEFHHEDETHVETNPYLTRVWHRRDAQPAIPAAGTNRRLTVFGSVEVLGRGRVEVVCAGQNSACFGLYLAALDARHAATGKDMYLAIDNGPGHTSEVSRAALATRADWLHVIWLAKCSPELNRKEREWRVESPGVCNKPGR